MGARRENLLDEGAEIRDLDCMVLEKRVTVLTHLIGYGSRVPWVVFYALQS